MTSLDRTTPARLARAAAGRARAAFTLIELVAVVVILAVLGGIAVVGFTQYSADAKDAAVKEQLRQLTNLAMLDAYTAGNTERVTREMFYAALGSLEDAPAPIAAGAHAAGAGWALLPSSQMPATRYQFSLGFDDGLGSGSPINDEGGTRVVAVTKSDSGRYFASLALAAPTEEEASTTTCETFAGATAIDVLNGHCYEDEDDVPDIRRDLEPAPAPSTPPAGDGSGEVGATPGATPGTGEGTGAPSPVPAPATPVNWSACTTRPGEATARARTTSAYIAKHGDSAITWEVIGDTEDVIGFKICEVDPSTGALTLVAATGPGTGHVRSWLVPTNVAHPNVFLEVSTVFANGDETAAVNSCEVRPAGRSGGWNDGANGHAPC